MSIDLVTLRILANHCAAASESMANTLVRTAHSTFVKETEDFTTGLATPEGATFASPLSLGATWFVGLDYGPVLGLIDSYEPGDICITNDPYSGFVCTHSPDVHLWMPIFEDGEIVCFAVGHVHNTDIGGAVPASLSRANTEVHQEGIRVPPRKLFRRGELDRELLDLMMLNVRMPEQNWGDLKAQIAAMRTGERRVRDMLRRFGSQTFRDGEYALLDHAERQARQLISKIPDGEYFFADYMDEDSVGGNPCRIAVNMVVDGDEILFDFSQCDPQLSSSLNMPTGGNERHVLLMIPYIYAMYAMDHSVFLNSGLLRPSRCLIPSGSIVNAEFPAAVGMRSLSAIRLQSCVLGAFAKALPDKMPAAAGDGGPLINLRTSDPLTGRRLMANLDPITGGGGGVAFRDGTEGSGAQKGFFKNTPVEINEAEVPVKILEYGLATDSAGAGRWRGGLGTTLRFQVMSPNSVVTARNRDRSRFTPFGIQGGQAGKVSSFKRNPGSNREEDLGNTDVVAADPGDIIHITSAGAGGWGSPLQRRPEQVLRDVECGFVSIAGAERDYGVVIVDGRIDEKATESARAMLASTLMNDEAGFGFNAARMEYEQQWTRENYAALMQKLYTLPTNWRFFVKQRVFEMLAQKGERQRNGESNMTAEDIGSTFQRVVAQYPELSHSLVSE